MKRPRILIIDDEPKVCSILSVLLTEHGYEVRTARSGQAGLRICAAFLPMVVVLDLKMPDMGGIAVMEELDRRYGTDARVIIITAYGDIRSAVNAMKKGAFDYIEKPFDNDTLLALIGRAIEMATLKQRVKQLEDQIGETYSFENMVGVSDGMKSTFALMRKYAAADGTVLVCGESGTGKELAVRAIHQASARRKGPFVVVNCGAIPPSLLESEFFGHEAGAFTGANATRIGKFEAADGGTLFLDEIGELPFEAQVKLLRVIESGGFNRVGSNNPLLLDVRVMAATNRDISSMVEEGRFRDDLYWRLNVLSLFLCPLRERKEDMPLLVDHFLDKYGVALKTARPAVSREAMELLTAYDWPGNVRELEHCIYGAMTISDGPSIRPCDLPNRVVSKADRLCQEGSPRGQMSLVDAASRAIEQAEREAIGKALEETNGNRSKAAELLEVGRKTLYRKLLQYGIS